MGRFLDTAKKYSDFLVYCVFGALATFVNAGSYWVFYEKAHIKNVPATLLAWFITLVFAFFTNKIFVYRSKGWNLAQIIKESSGFFICRALTGIFDVLFMYITVDVLDWIPLLMKLIAALIVGIINYLVGKLLIFSNRKTKSDSFDISEDQTKSE